jgi:hypothetical protein
VLVAIGAGFDVSRAFFITNSSSCEAHAGDPIMGHNAGELDLNFSFVMR